MGSDMFFGTPWNLEHVSDAVLRVLEPAFERPLITFRAAGDAYVLVEYGPMRLDLSFSLRAHYVASAIRENPCPGVLETAPGVRSLLIHYDGLQIALPALLEFLVALECSVTPNHYAEVSSREVVLPVSYRDRWTRDAIEKYRQTVRQEAPYLPDNVEFLARANGLESADEVIRYHLSSEYMVLGLGDVYLGAPCALALDPRYRLIAPKYNPARVFTYEGTVGIGGSYMCIYPMNSPGGYQMIGRTLQIWDTHQKSAPFVEAPYLFRPFDRIRFEAVSEAVLETYRRAMVDGRYELEIRPGRFCLSDYENFLTSIGDEVSRAERRRRQAVAEVLKGY